MLYASRDRCGKKQHLYGSVADYEQRFSMGFRKFNLEAFRHSRTIMGRQRQDGTYYSPASALRQDRQQRMTIFPIRNISPLNREMFPEKLPGATGSSLMTWESLSGYPLDRSSPLEYHLLFTCAGNSCKEVITHVIDNIVSLKRNQPAPREPAPHHRRHSRLLHWQ